MDTILNKTFSYAKKLAKEFYFKEWAQNPPKCLAFDNEIVHISHYGWNHLVHLRKRTKFELLGRLFVLERARELLKTALHYQSHIRRDGVEFWSFEALVNGVLIKVIVRSIKNGNKHFFSVIRKGSVEKEISKGK